MKFLKNRKLKLILLGQMIVLLFLLSSINLATTAQAETNQSNLSQTDLVQQMQNADLVAIYDQNASTNIKMDGVISPGEYPETFNSFYTGMNVSMAYNGTNANNSYLFIGLQAPTSGWLGIGFNDLGYGMIGADIKAAWINPDNSTHIEDDYATQYSYPSIDPGNHSVQTSQANNSTFSSTCINGNNTDYTADYSGSCYYVNKTSGISYGLGSNNIVEAKGTYYAPTNTTTIEMIIRMQSNFPIEWQNHAIDPTQEYIPADRNITVNQSMSMLLAWGETKGLTYHIRKEEATLFVAPEGVKARTATKLSFAFDNNYAGSEPFTNNTYFLANATLLDANGNPISGAVVGVYYEGLVADNLLQSAITDANGVAMFNFTFQGQYSNNQTLFRARYLGDLTFKKSQSDSQTVNFVGTVPTEEAPFLLIPLDMDYILPWLTGIGAVSAVAFMWTMFAFVIYTVLYKNAFQPDAKQKKYNGGN